MNSSSNADRIPGSTEAHVDFEAALAMAGGDMGLLRELAAAFLQEVPYLLDQLHTAIGRRDSNSLRNGAHQLQGVMRCLHIEEALSKARVLEVIGQEPVDWTAAEEALNSLKVTIDSAVRLLEDYLQES